MTEKALAFALKQSEKYVDKDAIAAAQDPNNKTTEDEEQHPSEWNVDLKLVERNLNKIDKMRRERKLCDLTIGLADGKLEAHRSILSAGSTFLRRMLMSTKAKTVNFYHIKSKIADILFQYIYTKKVKFEDINELSVKQKKELLEKAHLFEIFEHFFESYALCLDTFGDTTDTSTMEATRKKLNEIKKEKLHEMALFMNEQRKKDTEQKVSCTDWKIRIKTVDIHVNKTMLAATCGYFSDLFATNSTEANAETYTLTNLHRITFRKVLDFIYVGHLEYANIEINDLKELAFQANYLRIQDLMTVITSLILNKITMENCINFLQYAITMNCEGLKKQLLVYIGKLGSDVVQCKDFLEAKFDLVKVILLNPKLMLNRNNCMLCPCDFEDAVFHMLLEWIRADYVSRSTNVTDIFQLINIIGKPPYTGNSVNMHKKMPKELNHVMGNYYNKLISEENQQETATNTSSLRIKRENILPKSLIQTHQFPVHFKYDSSMTSYIDTSASLGPWDWRLCQLKLALGVTGQIELLKCSYQPNELYTNETKQDFKTICVPQTSADNEMNITHDIQLMDKERIISVILQPDTNQKYTIHSIRTSTGAVYTICDYKEHATSITVASPLGCHGYLHGLELQSDQNQMSVSFIWTSEDDVDLKDNELWCSTATTE